MQGVLLLPALMVVAVAVSDPLVINSTVEVYHDAILPCVIPSDMTGKIFNWKREDRKKVFLYREGKNYNNGELEGQDPQFKDRVFFFSNQLQYGNASIKLKSADLSDSGVYTCEHISNEEHFPVSKVNLTVRACSKILVKKLGTKDGALLLCSVSNASPKPELEFQDSSGNTVRSSPQYEDKTMGFYNVIIHTVVKKTDKYRCVVKQLDICHESSSDWIHVDVTAGWSGSFNPWMIGFIVAVVLVVLVCVIRKCCFYKNRNKVVFRLRELSKSFSAQGRNDGVV